VLVYRGPVEGPLVPCVACNRHIHAAETSCPFCGAKNVGRGRSRAPSARPKIDLRTRLHYGSPPAPGFEPRDAPLYGMPPARDEDGPAPVYGGPPARRALALAVVLAIAGAIAALLLLRRG
jgi:hypothetical protein